MRSYIDADSVKERHDAKACLQTCDDAYDDLCDGNAFLLGQPVCLTQEQREKAAAQSGM